MLSARELNSSLLPPNAQTWVNRHVLFTHGNGVVMSPVTRVPIRRATIFPTRLGMTEPSFLKQAGVDMRKSAPNRQFLPPNNPAWAQFFKK
jgi:Uncharacterised protein family (UPF0182)